MTAPIDKLRKLRARAARRDGCEADNARVRLLELLERCGLTEADLDDAEPGEALADEQADWDRERLSLAVARVRGCEAMLGHGRLIFRGRARCARSAAQLYRAFVEVGTLNATLRDAPPAVLAVFVRVFWGVYVDCVVERLGCATPTQVAAQADAEVAMNAAVDALRAAAARASGAKKPSLAERAAAERARLRAAQEAMLESLGLEGLDPHEAAERVQAAAVSRAQRAAAAVPISEPPTWGHEPVAIRGHLPEPSDRFRTVFRIGEEGADYADERLPEGGRG